MRNSRKKAAWLLLFICLLFAPVLVLWAALLMRSDSGRVSVLEDTPPPRKFSNPTPAAPKSAPASASGLDGDALSGMKPAAPTLAELINQAKEHHSHYPRRPSDWNELSPDQRMEVREFLGATDPWAEGFCAFLDRATLPEELLEADATHEPSCLLHTRLLYQLDAGYGPAAAKSFQRLLQLSARKRSLPNEYPVAQTLSHFNESYQRLQHSSPLSAEELHALADALGQDPEWSLEDDMIWARYRYAEHFKRWAELTPAKAIEEYGAFAGASTWLWKSPAFRHLFNRDVELFMENMDKLVLLAATPWWEVEEELATLKTEVERLPATYEICRNWFPGSILAFEWQLADQAAVDLLRLAMLIEAYHRVHGEYPEDLEALGLEADRTPSIDPFTGEQYRYELKEYGYTLHSVGPAQRSADTYFVQWQIKAGDTASTTEP